MTKTPRRIGETVFTDRGLRLPSIAKMRAARWPWVMLAASPFVGVALAYGWNRLL